MNLESESKPVFVMVLPSCRGRAIGDNAIRRAEAMASHYQPVIISDSFPDQMPGMIETIRVTPQTFNYLRRFAHVPNELGFAHSTRKPLLQLCRHRNVKFILCHGYTVTWHTGLWVRNKTSIPIGMFMHGHIFERPKGMYDPRLTAFYRAIAPTCYRQADLMLALSPAQAELAIAAGAHPASVIVAPNGLSAEDIGITSAAVNTKLKAEPRPPWKLLYTGRFAMEKGITVLLKACGQLKRAGIQFQLKLVGAGTQEAELRHLVDTLDIKDLVVFCGQLPRSKLGLHYIESHILCVPSLTEALGNVVLEGMAGGCAVVASDTGGIPSIIDDQTSGLLFHPGDVNALSASLMRLFDKPELITKFGRKASSEVKHRFSWKAIGMNICDSVSRITTAQH